MRYAVSASQISQECYDMLLLILWSKSLVEKSVLLSSDACPSFPPEDVSSCIMQDLLGIGEYRPGASRAP